MSNYMFINGELYNADELMHYGVPGMKWGKRNVRGHAGPGIYLTKKRQLAGDKKDLEYINKGGHLSVGLTKKRQAAYDAKDKVRLEKRIAKTEASLHKKSVANAEKKKTKQKASKQSVVDDKKFNKTSKDFDKLKKHVSKAQKSAKDYYDEVRKNTYISDTGNSLVINNTKSMKLMSLAKKHEKKANKVISKLEKKYGTVSAVPNYDTKKGKSYVETRLDNFKERIYEDD